MFERFLLFAPPDDQGADAPAETPAESPSQAPVEDPYSTDLDFDAAMAELDAADGSPFGRDPAELRTDTPDEPTIEEPGEPADEPGAAETATEDVETADDTTEAEAPAEAESGTDVEPEAETTPEPAKPDFSQVEAVIPGAVIESMDDVVEHLSTYLDSHEVLEGFEQIVDGDDYLMHYLTLRKKGTEPVIAAIEAFGEIAQPPDPDVDPEAYADWKAERKAAKVRSEYEKKTEKQASDRLQRLARSAQETFDATAKRLDLSDEDRTSLAGLFESLTKGDPVTGRFPSKAFEILHQGRRAMEVQSGIESALAAAKKGPEGLKSLSAADGDHEIVKSVKQALRDAYLAGAKQAGAAKKKVPQVPDLTGSRGGELSDADQETQKFARSLQVDDDWVKTAKRQGVYQNGQ